MSNTIVRLYDSFTAAESARNALLKSGFSIDDIQWTANEDEAGPVQGNFTVGNGNAKDPSYAGNFADALHRNAYMITVDAIDDEQCNRAANIMDEFGADTVKVRTTQSRKNKFSMKSGG